MYLCIFECVIIFTCLYGSITYIFHRLFAVTTLHEVEIQEKLWLITTNVNNLSQMTTSTFRQSDRFKTNNHVYFKKKTKVNTKILNAMSLNHQVTRTPRWKVKLEPVVFGNSSFNFDLLDSHVFPVIWGIISDITDALTFAFTTKIWPHSKISAIPLVSTIYS